MESAIDTTTSQGKFIFHMFCAFAELERNMIVERTMAGLESARRQGRRGGRPKGMNEAAKSKARIAESLWREKPKMSVEQICKTVGVSKATLYKYLESRGVKVHKYSKKRKIK